MSRCVGLSGQRVGQFEGAVGWVQGIIVNGECNFFRALTDAAGVGGSRKDGFLFGRMQI